MQILSSDLRKKFLDFFRSKNHAILESAPLVPENDPSVLFNTAGMQPLVPYLLGEKHPMGKRLADVQKCVRTGDIDDVGDNSHLTFFEMLGNWSLGDYFKEDSIRWSYEFLTSKEWLGLNPKWLAVTVFEGNADAPADDFSASVWESLGFPKHRISRMPARHNWWAAGATGPCGPDTEIFYWVGEGEPNPTSNVKDEEDDWMEIWNNVFMEFNRLEDGSLVPLPAQNVDTGMGLERTTAVLNGKKTVYHTDVFADVLTRIKEIVGEEKYNERSARIIADHTRTGVHMISDGVYPKNVDQGYVLRRLLRRAIREFYKMGYEQPVLAEIGKMYIEKFSDVYGVVKIHGEKILEELTKEEEKFGKTLKDGIKEFEKLTYLLKDVSIQNTKQNLIHSIQFHQKNGISIPQSTNPQELALFSVLQNHVNNQFYKLWGIETKITNLLTVINNGNTSQILTLLEEVLQILQINNQISGFSAFRLYDTYGFPLEMTLELAYEQKLTVDVEGFKAAFEKHQELSRTASEGKFKGGLAGSGEMETKYHSATHMLLAGLRKILGEHVFQAGSNITAERLRFDFTHGEKMLQEQIKMVEDYVNMVIRTGAVMTLTEMAKTAAKESGVVGSFWEKYPDIVKVYTLTGPDGTVFSRELCGGPHISDTTDMGTFKIVKEEASSSGVRRIKAILEK